MPHSLWCRCLLGGATVAVMTMGLVRAWAQESSSAPASLRFEVASVKTSASPSEIFQKFRSGGGGSVPFLGMRAQPGGRLIASGVNLQSLILAAYGIKSYQLEGGPSWLTTDYFEINAKAEAGNPSNKEINEMLKALLADRFGLRVHTDTRQVTVNTLMFARSDGKLGSGIKKTSPECEAQIEERKHNPPAAPPAPQRFDPKSMTTPICGMMMTTMSASSSARLMIGGQPFARFIDMISNELNAPVVDNTGLTGLYDIVIEYESTHRVTGLPPGARPPGLDPNSTDSPGPPLPSALQQQLGLKLEKTLGPLPITVVDAAEHPSAD